MKLRKVSKAEAERIAKGTFTPLQMQQLWGMRLFTEAWHRLKACERETETQAERIQ